MVERFDCFVFFTFDDLMYLKVNVTGEEIIFIMMGQNISVSGITTELTVKELVGTQTAISEFLSCMCQSILLWYVVLKICGRVD
jgi:hypothetical protein